ncbi:glycosyltransferase [Mesorhizobium sp. M8A.F.Ca.ET.202.01.1.1]|nr:glycosyltransferase [Mesorhizobium sp. M8A.F.Ca.ET.202.01.1.1]TGR20197.1 glycosyltransferase [Mesorhizobium sp. M8A.F.Ca.ET.197.01.1.1]TGR37786.1 glycosyltransferase [bacterium M00.F.Ca.ET.199.01.1.1]TGR43197.1 glycosyltransferase [Mesorhizobium sp. M8A.F.Ca.ET.198.01.1.1]TGU23424.1 glycosyltransferase [bacterium M00.F.Ca.ET.156.01.1.1]TGV90775.1 glycosyltransferase [Mesorhizobium sp. M00.F.Ca.ET.149.01.1.1]
MRGLKNSMNKLFNFSNRDIEVAPFVGDDITPDVTIATLGANFGCHSAARRVCEIFGDTAKSTVIWQADVYHHARRLAEAHNISNIIDIGCGNGDKLAHYFPRESFNTIGVDFLSSLLVAKGRHLDRRWVECDITQYTDIRQVFESLSEHLPAVIILSDVIEHLVDVRPLVSGMRTLMRRNERSRLVVSTPDRSRLQKTEIEDLPNNRAHVREWNLEELIAFFISAGFCVDRCGWTRMNQFDESFSTSYLELSFSTTHYLDWLLDAGLIYHKREPHHILITSEFQGVGASGGIGTVVEQQRQAYGPETTLVVYVGPHTPLHSLHRRKQLTTPRHLFADDSTLRLPTEDLALEAIQQLLFFFPDLETVQYQEYQGIGLRVAQAGRAALFPPQLRTVVHCHGAVHYLENGMQTWIGASADLSAVREKIAIEHSDTIVFPSKFLKRLYEEAGIASLHQDIRVIGYPYSFSAVDHSVIGSVDKLVFVGKRISMKGFHLFLQTIVSSSAELLEAGVRFIVIIGPKAGEEGLASPLLDQVRAHFFVDEHTDFHRDDLLLFANEHARSALFVLPYLADNQPLTVFDIIDAGALPILMDAGGVPEMLPHQWAAHVLSKPTSEALSHRILHVVNTTSKKRTTLAQRLKAGVIQHQADVRRSLSDVCRPKSKGTQGSQGLLTTTVVIPYFNTDIQYIKDLTWSLENQSLPPDKVIFVDDCSDKSNYEALLAFLKKEVKLDWSIIRHKTNKGLAGARNSALVAANTALLINVDSDDIPLNNFIRDLADCFNNNPNAAAAVPFLQAFEDGTKFELQRSESYVYRPLGDGLIAALTDNILGHANSGFRVDRIRAMGGWDDTDKSKYEDWALYMRLISSGEQIAIVPRVGCLYRIRSSSMVRTYATWPGLRRIARNIQGIPRFDAFRIEAQAYGYLNERNQREALSSELNSLNAQVAALNQERDFLLGTLAAHRTRRAVRITDAVALRIGRFPMLSKAILGGFRIACSIGAKCLRATDRRRR